LNEMVPTYPKNQCPKEIHGLPYHFPYHQMNYNKCETCKRSLCDFFVQVVFFKILNMSLWGW
jgi:hypothetical protein